MSHTLLETGFKIALPRSEELSVYYQSYLKYVNPDDDLRALLHDQKKETASFLSSISEENASRAYAPGKWMLKEVAGHVCDAERIMSYRALALRLSKSSTVHVLQALSGG